MAEEKQNRSRVSRRSSTGTRGASDRQRGERISIFDDAEDIYGDDRRRDDDDRRRRDDDRRDEYDRRRRDDDRHEEYDRRRRDDDRRDEYDRRRRDDDRRDEYDRRRYDDDRRRDEYDRRRYDDDRRRDEYDRRRYDDDRRRDEYDRRRYDDDRRRDEYDRRRYDDDRRRDDERRYEAPRGEKNAREEDKRRVAGASRNKKRSSTKRPAGDPDLFVHQIVPYVMFWVALFAGISFILRDLCGLDGSTGAFGNWLANLLCGLFGIGAYLLPLIFVVLSVRWKKLVQTGLLAKKLVLSTAFLVLLSGIIHVFQETGITRGDLFTTGSVLYNAGKIRAGGGFFGGFVGEWLGYVLRLPGTILLACPLLIIIGIYLVGMTPSGVWQRISSKIGMLHAHRRERRDALYDGKETRPLRARKSEPRVAGASAPAVEAPAAEANGTARPHYTFDEDEEAAQKHEPPARHPDAAHTARPAAPAAAQAADDVVDIPDDEIVDDATGDDADEVSPRSGSRRDVRTGIEDILDDLLAEESEPVTPVAPTPVAPAAPVAAATPLSPETPTEKQPEGDYYAPFALPVRPFPNREKTGTAPAAPATPATTTVPAAAPATAAVSSADGGEEVLGQGGDSYREAASALLDIADQMEEDVEQTPVSPISPVAPAFPVYTPSTAAAPVADAPVTAPRTEAPAAGSGFAFFDEEDEEDAPVAPAPTAPARGVRMSFADEADTFEEQGDEELDGEDATEDAYTFAPPVRTAPMTPPARPAAAPVAARTEPVRTAPTPPPPEPPPAPREYHYPPITLLNEDQNQHNDDFWEEIEETKETLRSTLDSFNIHIQEEIVSSHGPSVTRYEVRPEKGVSVRSVINRIDDISLNLAASVRIEAPIPGKPAIGIEVPNKVRETVYMRTMLESEKFQSSKAPLEVPLGLDVGGEVRMCDLAKMPHLLIAGTTGSGKSVCINSILVSLIYKTSPEDLRLILIDPKQIEFAPYEHVPHLYMPIVTDMQRAAGALACAVQEMERRFSLIKDVGVRDIAAYNEAVKNDPEREHLPRMVIVIDEFADLKMSSTNNDPENFTCRLAQKARAAGIHLIIGTQRPSVDVITGKLKTNIASRIAFMVKQQVDSRTILDVNGAEALTGRGDMLYMPTNSQDKQPVRIQGAFVSDAELERVISYVIKHNDPVQYNQAFMDQIEAEVARAANQGRKGGADDYADDEADDGEDPLFRDALRIVVESQKAATSLLQRRLSVGYGRAAKLIDHMEALGYVSAPDGNKPRRVLITPQQYATMAMNGDEGFDDEY